MREFRLPSGEEHRLRFILPMKEPDVTTLLKTKGSPFYHPQLSREAPTLLKLTGCMPHDTLRIINGIDAEVSPQNTRKALDNSQCSYGRGTRCTGDNRVLEYYLQSVLYDSTLLPSGSTPHICLQGKTYHP